MANIYVMFATKYFTDCVCDTSFGIRFQSPLGKTYSRSGGSDGKEFACSAGDLGLIPEWGRSPGEGNGNPVFLPGGSHGQRSLVGYSP